MCDAAKLGNEAPTSLVWQFSDKNFQENNTPPDLHLEGFKSKGFKKALSKVE